MRVNPDTMNEVQKQQMDEVVEKMCERLRIDKDACIEDAVNAHGPMGAGVFLSGLTTGVDLGMKIAQEWHSCDPEPVGTDDGFLEST